MPSHGGFSGFGGGRQLPPEMEEAAEAKRKEFEAALASAGGGDGNDKPRGPRTVVCYICGREFGQSSIGIHEKQCAKKWEEAEAQKPEHERKRLPQRPDVREGATREERNEAARAAHEEEVMAHCPGCGRSFKDEATMQKHMRSCRSGKARGSAFGGSGGRQLPPEMEAAAEEQRKEFEAKLAAEGGRSGGGDDGGRGRVTGPRTVVCYICGREFGKTSIRIHEQQCLRKWEDTEAQKPPHQRRPLPQRPEVKAGATLEEWNEAARSIHEAQAMAHCSACGRTFKDEATLRKHKSSCRSQDESRLGGGGGRQLPPEMEAAAEAQRKEFQAKLAAEGGHSSGSGGGGSRPSGPRTVVCYICGREFGKTSIGIHEKQCAKKWEDAEAQKPLRDRKPLPERPEIEEGATREEKNEAARAIHEAQAMAHCPGCGRSFKDEETLRKHQRSCRAGGAQAGAFGGGGGRQLPPEMEAAAEAQRREFEAKLPADGGRSGGGGGGAQPAGPRTVVCFICGREFGRSSIGIHEKQCARKWEEAEERKPPHDRKPLPQRPEVREGATREEQNEAAKAAHEAQAMAHCPGCGRSFKDEETLRKHQRSCRAGGAQAGAFGGGGGRQLPPEIEVAAEAQRREFEAKLSAEGGRSSEGGGGARPSGPRTAVCYICGREFGSSSIGIHERQCARKWEEAEAQRPPHERKPLPQRPDVREGATREEQNEAAKAAHETQAMAHCPGCGRTFKDEETLRRHLRSCKIGGGHGPPQAFGGSSGRRLPPELEAAAEAQRREFEAKLAAEGGGGGRGGGGGDGGRAGGPRTVACYICGREFGMRSIGIHEKQCARKWAEADARKPEHERKPLPQRPEVQEGASREERNEAARAVHKAEAMAHCPRCGRTFKDDETMRRHLKGCRSAAGSGPPRASPEDLAGEDASEELREEHRDATRANGGVDAAARDRANTPARATRRGGPQTVECYICGCEFGRSSIGMHERQCAGRWEEAQAKRPPEEREPLPERGKRPGGAGPLGDSGRIAGQGTSMLLELFQRIDSNESGAIDSTEFETAMQAFAKVGEEMNFEIDYSFATMDSDHSGFIDFKEFEQSLMPMEPIFGRNKFANVVSALIQDVEARLP